MQFTSEGSGSTFDMANRLAQESSLYLRQHAENPVDWFPWGPEALEKARSEEKPLLVSIGYSACHWCHVMARESFEDDYIAGIMNEHFVCIKIDREERPDLDHLYMEAVQMMNDGQGGWPLNVFCLPDGRPFAGGTYFPPDDRRGGQIVPWPQLLVRVSDYFRRQRSDLEENAVAVMKNLGSGNIPVSVTGDPLPPDALLSAAETIAQAHDDEAGGFGRAPKFPPAMTLDFLLAIRNTRAVEEQRPSLARRLDEVMLTSLSAMARGGLFDHVGGGFSRYCVDREWIVPHFEKMLYDNGLLLTIYSRAYRRYGDEGYRAVVAETIGWLDRELAAPGGGYFSALAADSDGEEGKFYVWNPPAVVAVLGEERGRRFCEAYGITDAGNFENGWSQPVFLPSDDALREKFAADRAQLLQAREKRVRPGRDEKRLVGWNCLVVIGLAEAAWTFGEKAWLQQARAMVDWIWDELVTERPEGLHLARGAYERGAFGDGVIDDYGAFAEACLSIAAYTEWLERGTAKEYRERAGRIAETVLARFVDPHALGFYFTDRVQRDVLQRKKEWFDSATPAGQSHLVHVARDLYQLTGESRWAELLERMSASYPGYAQRAPQGIGHALSGLTQAALGVSTVGVRSGEGVEAVESLRAVLVQRPFRRLFVEESGELRPDERFQLCVGTQCLPPTDDLAEIAALL